MPLPARYMQDSTKRSFSLAAPAAADGEVSGMLFEKCVLTTSDQAGGVVPQRSKANEDGAVMGRFSATAPAALSSDVASVNRTFEPLRQLDF